MTETVATVNVETPKSVNFLRVPLLDGKTIDVGCLSDDEAEGVGEAIKQAFIANVKRRRA